MSMNLTPYLKSPFTDALGHMYMHQDYGRCGDFEMAMMNCMEAYGTERAQVKCRDLIDDFKECHTQQKQIKREHEMRIERHRQVLMRERAWKDYYAPPPPTDSY